MNIFKPSHGIAFDIDGIILDTATHLWNEITGQLGLDWHIDKWTTYDIEDIVNKSIDELRPIYEPILARENIPMVGGAKPVLQWLHAQFPEEALLFITARRLQFKDAAINSIRKELGPGIPFKVICTMENDSNWGIHRSNKLELLQKHGITFFIEDNPRYWDMYIENGIEVGTLLWPWTEGEVLKRKDNNKLICFDQWEDLLAYFQSRGLSWTDRHKSRIKKYIR